MASNKRKETSTTDFFLSVVQKEDAANKKVGHQPLNETKEKANSFLETVVGIVNNVFDTILSNKISMIVLSGIIACVLFMMISGGNIFSSPSSGTTLEEVPLHVEGLDDKYDIEGVPDTVEIGLIGPSLDLNSVTLTKNYEAYIDVNSLLPGTHTVNVQTKNFPDTLSVMVVPQSFQVTISPKVSQKFSLGYKFINEDMMNENNSAALKEMAVKSVTVRASQDTLQKIDSVKACIDVEDVDTDFEQDAVIKAFNKKGKELKVDIAPNTVHVSCTVSTYKKELSVKANFTGTPANNVAISNYKLSTNTVTVYGDENDLKDVEQAEVDIDITDLYESTTIKDIKVKVDAPYNKLSRSKISCSLEFDEQTSKDFTGLSIEPRNLTEGLTCVIDEKATVRVTGSKALLDSMTNEDVVCYVDVKDMKKGSHTVSVAIDQDEQLQYAFVQNEKITLTIGG